MSATATPASAQKSLIRRSTTIQPAERRPRRRQVPVIIDLSAGEPSPPQKQGRARRPIQPQPNHPQRDRSSIQPPQPDPAVPAMVATTKTYRYFMGPMIHSGNSFEDDHNPFEDPRFGNPFEGLR